MKTEEMRTIAKMRGVNVETVRRWKNTGGEKYAREHVPLSRQARGKKARTRGREIVINASKAGPVKVTEESIARGRLRRACETIEAARELGNELLEVWD